jgi:FtsZ-binding cell division protein ZapB
MGPGGAGTGLVFPAANQMSLATNSVEVIRIDASGNVGIGTTAPGQALEVNGTIKATNLLLTSDRRMKRNIASLDHDQALEKICRVRPVSFNWRRDGAADEGVIAQELREIFPEMVIENADGSLAVKYSSLISPLIASVQELKQRNDSLTVENKDLKARVSAMEESQASMKAELDEIRGLLKSMKSGKAK